MSQFLLLTLYSFVGNVIFGSFCEWILHRYVMHRKPFGFSYAFRAHALVHHHQFGHGATYHLIHPATQDKSKITMAKWNGPVLILAFSMPSLVLSIIFGLWSIWVGSIIAFSAYYIAYEYMHWCMHLPKARRLEKSWIFRRLNGHHLLHHLYMGKNFNVVFPLADLCLGTLMRRSPIKFAPPGGDSIADVQPKTAE
jgi:hypothetical protein